MGGWRNQGVNFNQEVTRTRSNGYRKPPLGGSSNWQQSVPSWEKKFCTSVGSVPWKKIVETKKLFHLFNDVVKWDDSAGKEAFDNAKNRFYANMHGLPCNTGLPDPNMHIDEIDWNSQVDPNLLLDLESDSVPETNPKGEQVVIFGTNFPPSYLNFSPYGWGDSDDGKKKDPNTPPENNAHQWSFANGNEWAGVDDNNNWPGWNETDEEAKGGQGWGDSRNDYWGWNMYDNNNHFYGDVNNESGRYKTSRFRGDDNQRSEPRRNNGNGRKSRPWKPANYACATPGRAANRWSVKKPVS